MSNPLGHLMRRAREDARMSHRQLALKARRSTATAVRAEAGRGTLKTFVDLLRPTGWKLVALTEGKPTTHIGRALAAARLGPGFHTPQSRSRAGSVLKPYTIVSVISPRRPRGQCSGCCARCVSASRWLDRACAMSTVKPPAFAEQIIRWVINDAASRGRSGALHRVLTCTTPDGDIVICSWTRRGQDGIELMALFRPRPEHLARLVVDHITGGKSPLVEWDRVADAVALIEVSPSDLRYAAYAAKPFAARDIMRLPRVRDPDPAEVVRIFRNGANKQDQEMAA